MPPGGRLHAEDHGTHRQITLRLPRPFPWQKRARDLILTSPASFILLVMGRRAGKTTACADLSGRNALSLPGDNLWAAPTYKLADIGREKLHSMFGPVISHAPNLHPKDLFVSGGIIHWRSFDTDGGAIGRGYRLAVVDEAARVKRKIIEEDLLPTIADTGGKILAVTTPRGQRNWTFDWYCRAMSGNPAYAVIHGPSTENPSPAIRAFVELAKVNMPDHYYRQEILAEFLEGEGAVFRNIRRAIQSEGWLDCPPDPDRQYVIGCDLAKHQDYTVLYSMDMETGMLHGMERSNQVDWNLQADRIEQFSRRWNLGTVYMDSTGIGDVVYDMLVTKGVRVVPIHFGGGMKENLIRGLSIAFDQGNLGIPSDPVLLAELESFAYEVRPSGTFSYNAPEGLHDDCVIALALAVHGRLAPSQTEAWMRWLRRKAEG